MKWFIKCLKQYADFEGRARRKEYWWYWLIYLVISVVLMIGYLIPVVKMAIANPSGEINEMEMLRAMLGNPFLIVWLLFYLATLIPGIAVTVRRLHDIGKSGWWYLLPLGGSVAGSIGELFSETSVAISLALIAAFIGILFLVWMFTDSQPEANQWGPNPKEPNPTTK